MSASKKSLNLPDYQLANDTLSGLSLPISISELHGVLCGYICAGASSKGEDYLSALMLSKKNEVTRPAVLMLFDIFSISQQQITGFDFEFQLLLPGDDDDLRERAQAFSEWCEGFVQGLTISGIDFDAFDDEEAEESAQHIAEFSQLDYEGLKMSEDDEKALMEVHEYTRLAVLRIYGDLKEQQDEGVQPPEKSH